MRLVRIVWRDSGLSHEDGWRTAAQVSNQTVLVKTVGFVIHEDDDNITLAMGHSSSLDLYFGIHTVWKPSIKSICELEEIVTQTLSLASFVNHQDGPISA